MKQSAENNIKLALFMGMTKKYSYLHGGIVYESGFATYNEDELRYHSSFDWLIGVVHEIQHRYNELSLSIAFQEDLKDNPYDRNHIYSCCVEFVSELKEID